MVAAAAALLALTFLCAEAGHSNHKQNVSLLDNFRAPQPVGAFRRVYRSANASQQCLPDLDCPKDATSNACFKQAPPTKTKRSWGMSTHLHWSYYDQDGGSPKSLAAES